MTWPAADVVTTNLDAGSDSAASARTQLLDVVQKFNQLRNHVSAFMQGVVAAVDAAAARVLLGLTNHQLLTVDSSGNASLPGFLNTGGTLTAQASLSAQTGNVTAGTYLYAGTHVFSTTYMYATTYIQTPGVVYGGSASITGAISAGGNAAITGNITAGGNITATGNVSAYSDERLKTAWRPVQRDFVRQLAGVRSGTYRMKGRVRRSAGVGAQSLQKLLPEVIEADAAGTLSVAYGQAAMVACVELAREVVALRGEIAQLKGAA